MRSQPVPVTCDNIMDMDLDQVRISLFSILEVHNHMPTIDKIKYADLMGDYAAIYQYASELYTHTISCVRAYTEAKNPFFKMQAMDRRDMLEQYLKSVKMEYDALSRKITLFQGEDKT
jgi:hypothetical protein